MQVQDEGGADRARLNPKRSKPMILFENVVVPAGGFEPPTY